MSTETPQAVTQEPAPSAGFVNWEDPSFVPETSPGYDDDPIRYFRMSHKYPENPVPGRKFQQGGKERIAILESTVFHAYVHRFSKNWLNSGVNGVRRCTEEQLGHCLACDHYEKAGKENAHCGRKQQMFGVNIICYKSDLLGTLLDPQNRRILLNNEKGPVLEDGTPGQMVYEVFLWRFSSDKFVAIRELKQQWGVLNEHDLMCVLAPGKDEKFQDFTPGILPQAAWRLPALIVDRKQESLDLVNYYKEHKYNVEAIMGKNYTDEDMMGFLNLGSVGTQTSPQGDFGQVAVDVERELAQLGVTQPPGTAPPQADSAAASVDVAPPETAPQAAPEQPASLPAEPAAPAATPTPISDDFDELLK